MVADLPWPAVGALASGIGSVYLLDRLRDHLGKPGANWFVATIATITVWCVSYAGGLLVSTPKVRLAVEVLSWVCLGWIGYFFLSFALGYSGRTALLSSRWYRALAAVPLSVSTLAVANPAVPLLWQGYTTERVLGVVGAEYTFLPLGYLAVLATMLFVSVGTVLVFDTVVSYGPLYRREAMAVGLSPIPPGVGALLWALGVGPPVNLTTALFLPHVALDAYAFVRGGMFEFLPATQRAGERAAIDDIASPVAIVDQGGRVVNLNPAAEAAFGVDEDAVLTRPLEEILTDGTITIDGTDGRVGVGSGRDRREFKTRQTSLHDEAGTQLGYTIVFQDVTEELRRERRLEVLNRFLRHNVRNEGVVIQGRSELLAESLDDDRSTHAEVIGEAVDRLVDSGEKARTLADASTTETVFEPVELVGFVADVIDSLEGSERVTVSAPARIELETQPVLLDALVRNLVENALVHTADDSVAVTLAIEGEAALVTVDDDGPGIPDHELAVLDRGRETDLSHGSGIGLWLVRWVATTLGAELVFRTDDGTAVTVRLPVDPGA